MIKAFSEIKAARLLADIEQKFGLFQLRVYGYSPWRLIRFPVGVALQNLAFQVPRLSKIALFCSCVRSLCNLLWLPRARYVVKSFSSALRLRSAIGYEDIYFEDLLQSLSGGLRMYSLNAGGYEGRKASWRGPQVDVTLVLVVGSLMARLFPVRSENHIFEQISRAIAGYLPEGEFPPARIRRMFSSFWWQSKLYCWILRRIGVSTVLVADTGERALLKAARNLNCHFVELQHGVFTPSHPDSIPYAETIDASDVGLLLPDLIATYGRYWVGIHSPTLLGRAGRVMSVGASFMERLRLKKKESVGERNFQLLVTTQGLARTELIKVLREFLEVCAVPVDLTIKLHPTYDVSLEPYLEVFGQDDRVKVISGRDNPHTYSLLLGADLHLSISSTCHYDSIGLMIPTVVLALPSYEIVINLVQAGEACLVHNGSELAKVVALKAWKELNPDMANKYYRPGFVSNILELIKQE